MPAAAALYRAAARLCARQSVLIAPPLCLVRGSASAGAKRCRVLPIK